MGIGEDMTRPTRAQLRELCEKATQGPWVDRRRAERAEVWSMGPDIDPYDEGLVCDYIKADDAAFIAAARTAVPALLDENDALRALLRMAREYFDTGAIEDDRARACLAEIDAALDEEGAK